ncbi:MAG: sigma-54-dependent Fis family transcriptional regulator [Deltaproteobacteria bacterium]|nr:sigma-54-dependent Fis family transcriptional regulator [Deltaproteobacteria bacterium]
MTRAVSRQNPKVLVVEDDEGLRSAICAALARRGFDIVAAESCAEATDAFAQGVDVVVTDLRLPDGDALQLLPRLRETDATVPVLIVTGYGTIDLAVRAVKQGAMDFLTKPLDLESLSNAIVHAAEQRSAWRSGRRPKLEVRGPSVGDKERFRARSDAMKRIDEEVEKLRDADCSVLILGETGTGKSLLARRIHAVGARSGGAIVDINCAGLTREFVETELFGHERGAFTGAHSAKQGLLDLAHGGTLFLDEIGDVDAAVQPKLLKVLEEKRFRRMGDVRERTVDIRLLAATHLDLLDAVAAKRFRADLYYRISTVSLTMPPLRERREDIVPMAYQILQELGAPQVELSREAKQALTDHVWPGNVRELKNVLERMLLLRHGDVVGRDSLRFDASSTSMRVAERAMSSAPSTRTLSEVEREHIVSALAAENGKVEAAARRLGIPRSTLYQRIKDYGIDPAKHRLRRSEAEAEDDI